MRISLLIGDEVGKVGIEMGVGADTVIGDDTAGR